MTDPTGTYAMAYDNMGRLIGTLTQYSFLPGHSYINAYAYDAASNRTGFTAPDGSTDTYGYDTLNRLSSLADSQAGSFGFSYDGLSRRTQLTRPNGVNTNYGYDSLSRLLSVLHQNGTNTLDGATYAYDNAGNRTAKTNKLNNITEQYTYDPLYQLTQVTQGATTTESYSYDAVGNRLSSVGVPSYSYNSSNELTSTTAASFTYDANGNTLSKTNASGTTQYAWDFENRLNSVIMPTGTVSFAYDPFGRRIQKAFTQGSTTTVTSYLYDVNNSIEELDGNGSEIIHYSQDRGLDEPVAEAHSTTVSYYQQDGLGSVTSLSSSAGAVSNSYIYDGFGNLIASTGSIVNPFQFTGRDYDPETGLGYYRARYYAPDVGRFTNEDPLQFDAGMNFYSYTRDNPVNFVDPHGMQSQAAPSGPLPPAVQNLFIANLDDPKLGGIARPPYPTGIKFFGHDQECVSLTKYFTGLPCTDCWRAGQPVLGSNLPEGTAIATFDSDGRYPGNDRNSGLYLMGNGPFGFWIIDQWPPYPELNTPAHPANIRPVRAEPTNRRNNSLAYYAITVRYGTKSKKCKCGNW